MGCPRTQGLRRWDLSRSLVHRQKQHHNLSGENSPQRTISATETGRSRFWGIWKQKKWKAAAPSSDPGAKNLHELHPFPRPSQLRFSPLARPATTGTCSLLWTEHSPEPVCRRAEKRAGEQGTCVTDALHLFRCLLRKHMFRENLFWPARSPTWQHPFQLPVPPPCVLVVWHPVSYT